MNRLEDLYKSIRALKEFGLPPTTGSAISKVLPPVSRFTPSGKRTKKRDSVLERLKTFFDKLWDISWGKFKD